MKPLKLIIHAFGPFADEQVIDFTRLSEDGIFLITGPTGAGKTSVFDALTFALYGKASGESRQAENFKSDYADDTTLCWVELVFILRNEIYYIKRTPKQIKLTRNNTRAFISETAELILPNKEVITGSKEVDQKINELLGLDIRQFKQIVMLPQGEFRRLIESNSNDKLEIFRKIFKTQVYNRITEKLTEKSRETEQTISLKNERINTICSSLYMDDDLELIELTKEKYIDLNDVIAKIELINQNLLNQAEEKHKQIKLVEEQIKAIQLDTSIENNKKIIEAQNAQNSYHQLLARKEFFDKAKQQLVYNKQAVEVFVSEKAKSEKEQELQKLLQDIEVSQKACQNQQKEFEQVSAKYSQLEQKQTEKDNLLKLKTDYDNIVKQMSTIGEYKQKIQEIRANNLKKQASLDRCRLLLERADFLQDYDRQSSTLEMLNMCSSKVLDYNNKALSEQRIEQLYKFKYQQYINSSAAMLAENLEEGIPCPVCGSPHHPEMAHFDNDAPTKQELDQLLQEKDMAASCTADAKTALLYILSKLQEYEEYKEIATFSDNFVRLAKLAEHKENLLSIIMQLSDKTKQKQEECLKFLSVSELSQKKYREEEYLKGIITELEKAMEHNVSGIALYENNILKIEEQEQITGLKQADIQDKIGQLIIRENALKQDITVIQQEYINKKSILDKLGEKLRSLNEYKEQTIQLVHIKTEEFLQSLQKFEFLSIEEYKSHLLTSKEIESKEKEVSTYFNVLAASEATSMALNQAIKGKQPQDIDFLRKQQQELSQVLDCFNKEYVENSTHLKINQNCLKDLKPLQVQMDKLTREYADINRLQNVANGNNSMRLKFETFILTAYFDQIVRFANARFNVMTNFRYFLKRKEDKEKFGRQSGLDLEIVDTYTGKNRHVNTLSGGESFKASLSLALGLADVVQGNSAGVEVNTLFIDEGFGTLDPQSLDSAVETLMGLKMTGRLIGIISHVPELKEKVKCKLEVVPTNKGSRAEISI